MRMRWKMLFAVLGALLLAVGLIVALAVASVWAPDRPVDELKARWAPPPSTFLPLAGMSVHLRDQGPRDDPLPIVLIHGTSASLHTWEGWAAELAKDRRVVSFDLPGFGLTGPSPEGDYSIPAQVRFVGQLLDALHIERCVLAGNSLGGYIAWATALAAPQRVEKLILVDASGYPLASTSVPIGFRIAAMPGVNRLFESILPRRIVEASVRSVYGDPGKVTEQLVDRYYELALRAGNRHALGRRFAVMLKEDDSKRIAAIRQPTLILWGGRDRLIPPAQAERFHKDIEGSELVVFDDLGHVGQEEDPQRTVAEVKRFLGMTR
jgi:pimeloyl-ACP methyl ester carboxylesterase